MEHFEMNDCRVSTTGFASRSAMSWPTSPSWRFSWHVDF